MQMAVDRGIVLEYIAATQPYFQLCPVATGKISLVVQKAFFPVGHHYK